MRVLILKSIFAPWWWVNVTRLRLGPRRCARQGTLVWSTPTLRPTRRPRSPPQVTKRARGAVSAPGPRGSSRALMLAQIALAHDAEPQRAIDERGTLLAL